MRPAQSAFATRRRRFTAAVVAGTLVALGGGGAFAWWTSTGTGTGTATTGTSTAFTVASTGTTGGPLSPGGPTQTVAFTVTNPGTGSQMLTAVTAAVLDSVGDAWDGPGDCSAADYTVGTPAVTYGAIAGGANVQGTVTVTMINRPADQDDCKGATVPIYFEANPVPA